MVLKGTNVTFKRRKGTLSPRKPEKPGAFGLCHLYQTAALRDALTRCQEYQGIDHWHFPSVFFETCKQITSETTLTANH